VGDGGGGETERHQDDGEENGFHGGIPPGGMVVPVARAIGWAENAEAAAGNLADWIGGVQRTMSV
jgi:hypothetical protein